MNAEQLLRNAVLTSGTSVHAVAKAADVPQPVLHRFVRGQQGLTLGTAMKLMAWAGLELRPVDLSRNTATSE